MILKTNSGRLTAYGLARGYVERKGDSDNRAVLEREHNVYHVKGFKNGVHFWESFHTLTNARKYFASVL
jgi:hypothetical protein